MAVLAEERRDLFLRSCDDCVAAATSRFRPQDDDRTLTEHRHLRRLAVPLAHHVGAHAHVHASVALSRVGDHQLPAADLEGESLSRSHGYQLLTHFALLTVDDDHR